jgi:hypothetical protein
MNKKTKKKKGKNKDEELISTKEVGIYDDFLIIEKDEKKDVHKNEDKKEDKKEEDQKEEKKSKKDFNINEFFFFKDWVVVELKQSRFSDLFKQIKEEDENAKKTSEVKEAKEENEKELKKDDTIKNNSSLNLSSQNTFYTSKISINDSSLDNINNNNNIVTENKKLLFEPNNNNIIVGEMELNIDINKIISLEDKRTTIMIKNIPNKFNKDLLLSIIDQNFKGTYDLFIMPTDINKSKNFGYSFINFTSVYYIPYFYFMFNGKMWSSTNSKKVCELTYSKVQGKKDLLSHYPIKIIYYNEEAFNVKPEQQYIIPNVYKLIFNKFFPKEKIEEKKFYFITRMPIQD